MRSHKEVKAKGIKGVKINMLYTFYTAETGFCNWSVSCVKSVS